jgi:hypothetical protein
MIRSRVNFWYKKQSQGKLICNSPNDIISANVDSEKVDQDGIFYYKDIFIHFFFKWPKYYTYQKSYMSFGTNCITLWNFGGLNWSMHQRRGKELPIHTWILSQLDLSFSCSQFQWLCIVYDQYLLIARECRFGFLIFPSARKHNYYLFVRAHSWFYYI